MDKFPHEINYIKFRYIGFFPRDVTSPSLTNKAAITEANRGFKLCLSFNQMPNEPVPPDPPCSAPNFTSPLPEKLFKISCKKSGFNSMY